MAERRETEAEGVLERHLQALHRVTERDLPELGDTVRMLQARAPERTPQRIEEDFWMQSRRILRARPWLAGVAAAAIAAAILGIVPVSYERTTGHDVMLSLAGPAPDPQSLAQIAAEFKAALGAGDVKVRESSESSEGATTLEAYSHSRSRSEVEQTTGAFAAALGGRGLKARVQVVPRTQRVSSNVYAMAVDHVIQLHIDRNGKSPAEIEADLRAQLDAAGIPDSEVHVTQEGGQTQIRIQATSNTPLHAENLQVELKADGTEALHPTLHRFEVHREPGMTDADVRAEIERQMREAGVQGEVFVEDGKVRIEAHEQRQTAGKPEGSGLPAGAMLSFAGPNPAGTTRLSYVVPTATHVSLRVYDARGRLVKTLLDRDAAPGAATIDWDGSDDNGARVSKGVYYVRYVAGATTSEKKVVLR